MAIKLPDPGNGIAEDKTGYNEWENMKIVRDNFADQSNAASRLVGTGKTEIPSGVDILEAIVASAKVAPPDTNTPPDPFVGHTTVYVPATGNKPPLGGIYWTVLVLRVDETGMRYEAISRTSPEIKAFRGLKNGVFTPWHYYYSTANTTKDGNGFLKAASPIVDLYDDRIELNHDAERQGGINFEKLGTGNYLVKGSLGFAQEGWYIEMPKDANGNVLVAVVYEQLESNDLSIKTYDYMLNKKGRIVPDIETPLDIPEGRCINLRLHEAKEEIDEPIQ